ncbi:hypothetical protein Sste5346_009976 [Sporothrix stenoceras]|uniref:Capsule polysaccharide biosynthesis protein n=1 Tax=Sporothrix stenoceras TaxID=5173 RepID=A0ABR3YJ40_9PEZI
MVLKPRPLPPGRKFFFGYVEFHKQFGYIRIGSFKFNWRKVLWWNSPLLLRYSWRRLHCAYDLKSPLRAFLQLLWPFPRKWPIGALPPPPRLLLADGDAVRARYYRDAHVQNGLPLWHRRDTLQSAFYRLYEAICAADEPMVGYTTEYLFFRPEPEWSLDLLADPRTMTTWEDLHDSDSTSFTGSGTGRPWTEEEKAERLAVMARIAVMLEEVFNWRLDLGLRRDGSVIDKGEGLPEPIWTPERCPAWAHETPGLPELLVLSHTWTGERLERGWKPVYNIIIKDASMRTV